MSSTELSEGFIANISFGCDDLDEDLYRRSSVTPSDATPVGAACFWLGVDLLRRLICNGDAER